MRNLFLHLVLITTLLSCNKDDELNLGLPSSKNLNMIECYLTPNEPVKLSYHKSNPINEKIALELGWNAKGEIISDNHIYQLLNIFNTERDYFYNYVSKDTLKDGDHFDLFFITSDGDTISGSTQIVEPIYIKDIELISNSLLSINVKHESKTNHQRFFALYLRLLKDSTILNKSFYYSFFNNENSNTEILVQDDFEGVKKIKVILNHITKDNYDFQSSIKQAEEANENILNMATEIKGNLSNSLGIFTYYTSDKYELIIN